ncbi:MAG TPA: helix-turn-helix domain-containing protein [Acetobacteraceae bacterium]|nr:helix-turn-helix domain-containing protein [Acetobacteraceae bacterium]
MSKEPKGQDEADKLGDEAIGAIARRIVDLRKKKGLTQAELGKLAGVTQGRIFELEQRTSNITVRTLARMAQVLDVELVELVSGVHTASGNRLADVLEKWTNALAERTAFEKALMEEIRPIIEDMRVLSIRKLEEETRGPGGDAPGPSGAADRKPPRKTT